jgi:hypothetical protein
MMEKQLNDTTNPPTIDKIRDDLNLCFERLNLKITMMMMMMGEQVKI